MVCFNHLLVVTECVHFLLMWMKLLSYGWTHLPAPLQCSKQKSIGLAKYLPEEKE
jgi:hypothetical protein